MLLSSAFREFIRLSALLNRSLYRSRHCCFCQRKCVFQCTDSRTRRLPDESYTTGSSILCGFLCTSKQIVGASESSNSCPLASTRLPLLFYPTNKPKQLVLPLNVGYKPPPPFLLRSTSVKGPAFS